MRTFTIDDEEEKKIEEWLKTHDGVCRHAGGKNTGAIGGRLTFSFTHTSIGTVLKVQCACGVDLDATDYSAR